MVTFGCWVDYCRCLFAVLPMESWAVLTVLENRNLCEDQVHYSYILLSWIKCMQWLSWCWLIETAPTLMKMQILSQIQLSGHIFRSILQTSRAWTVAIALSLHPSEPFRILPRNVPITWSGNEARLPGDWTFHTLVTERWRQLQFAWVTC